MQWFADSLSLFLVNCKLSTVDCGLPSRVTSHGSRTSMMNEKKRLRVGILFGGRSGEHEVSLASAASVIRGLDPDKYEAVPIGITKEGHWLVGAGAQKMLPEVLKGGQRVMMTADPTDAALVGEARHSWIVRRYEQGAFACRTGPGAESRRRIRHENSG